MASYLRCTVAAHAVVSVGVSSLYDYAPRDPPRSATGKPSFPRIISLGRTRGKSVVIGEREQLLTTAQIMFAIVREIV